MIHSAGFPQILLSQFTLQNQLLNKVNRYKSVKNYENSKYIDILINVLFTNKHPYESKYCLLIHTSPPTRKLKTFTFFNR